MGRRELETRDRAYPLLSNDGVYSWQDIDTAGFLHVKNGAFQILEGARFLVPLKSQQVAGRPEASRSPAAGGTERDASRRVPSVLPGADGFGGLLDRIEHRLAGHAAPFQLPAHHPREPAAAAGRVRDVADAQRAGVEPVAGAQAHVERDPAPGAGLREMQLGGHRVDAVEHEIGSPVKEKAAVVRQVEFVRGGKIPRRVD